MGCWLVMGPRGACETDHISLPVSRVCIQTAWQFSVGRRESAMRTRNRFRDRSEAGRHLAAALAEYVDRPNLMVLALPRGGVPVGYEVARVLHAPLDIMLVRKLGVPGHEELAMGAIASGGVRILADEVVAAFGITEPVIA